MNTKVRDERRLGHCRVPEISSRTRCLLVSLAALFRLMLLLFVVLCSAVCVASAETYLTMWNNTTNPKEVSCRTAFDILCWCFGPVSQVRSLYRTGNATTCGAQFADLQTCMKVKAAAMKDTEEARVSG